MIMTKTPLFLGKNVGMVIRQQGGLIVHQILETSILISSTDAFINNEYYKEKKNIYISYRS